MKITRLHVAMGALIEEQVSRLARIDRSGDYADQREMELDCLLVHSVPLAEARHAWGMGVRGVQAYSDLAFQKHLNREAGTDKARGRPETAAGTFCKSLVYSYRDLLLPEARGRGRGNAVKMLEVIDYWSDHSPRFPVTRETLPGVTIAVRFHQIDTRQPIYGFYNNGPNLASHPEPPIDHWYTREDLRLGPMKNALTWYAQLAQDVHDLLQIHGITPA